MALIKQPLFNQNHGSVDTAKPLHLLGFYEPILEMSLPVLFLNVPKKIMKKGKIRDNIIENQSNLKNEIDSQKENYENLLDRTTAEIENFIKKHDASSKAQ